MRAFAGLRQITCKGVHDFVNGVGGEAAGQLMQRPWADSQGQPGKLWQEDPSLAYPPQPRKIVNVISPDFDGLQPGKLNERSQKFAKMSNLACTCHLNDQTPAAIQINQQCQSQKSRRPTSI